MGRSLAGAYAAARDLFAEVDDALSQPLSRLMFEGPECELTLTENAQPALLAASLAVIRALEAEGDLVFGRHVAYVAGHSLGEYSALAAARAVAAEAVRCANGSGEVCAVANDNAPGQVVVSGHHHTVERAIAIAREHGARRAIMLPVSAPFHSPLMGPAAAVMEEALADTVLRPPLVPLVANLWAEAISDPSEIRRGLVGQVTAMVRWRESVQFLRAAEVDEVAEIGTGRVLTGLVRRIEPDLAARSVASPAEVDALIKEL
jgi:[acyl-carrier-protein] S-malonyltransferase